MYHSNLKKNTTRTQINILLTTQHFFTGRVVRYWTRLAERHSDSFMICGFSWPTAPMKSRTYPSLISGGCFVY